MGGRERTDQKKEELEERKKDPKNQAMYVCDLQALKVGTPVRTRVRACARMGPPARRGDVPGLAQEASLKCQTTISTTKPNCTAQIQAYRVSSARSLTFLLTCSGVFHRGARVPESRVAPSPAHHVVREQDCLKAIAAEQKKERDKTFWGAWAK